MNQNEVKKILSVSGMTCSNCEVRIENKLNRLPGIIWVEVKYAQESVSLVFDSAQINLSEIIGEIEGLDYTVNLTDKQHIGANKEAFSKKRIRITKLIGAVSIIVGIVIMFLVIKDTVGFDLIHRINPSMGYGVLFVVGLINSLHCIAMCGGINLSLCASYTSKSDDKLSKLLPSALYNTGRVISYTLIGGMVGSIGSVINISAGVRGVGAIIAGAFMVLMGLNMLTVFPALRKVIPKMPKLFGNKIYNQIGRNSPFLVGLLNGFMPCGPLQTMQIYALGTGSFVSGALSMFIFSLGTVPLMFGFGAVSSMLSKKFTSRMMKISALLVIALGFMMFMIGFAARF